MNETEDRMVDQLFAMKTVVQVSDWRGDFREWLEKKGAKANTVKAYLIALSEFAEWFATATGQEFEPRLINSFDLVRYHQWARNVKRLSAATWNQRVASLRKLCKWARRELAPMDELFEDVKKEDLGDLPPDWLSNEEFGRLGSYLSSTGYRGHGRNSTTKREWRALRDRAILTVMLFAGLREFEAAALLASDVELTQRKCVIHIQAGKGGREGEVQLGDVEARKILRRWVELRGDTDRCAYFFPDDKSGKLSERQIQNISHDVGRICGIEDLRPHRLRHTCAKRMTDAGEPMPTVQGVMRHRNSNTTARYARPGRADLENATALISQGRMARTNYFKAKGIHEREN